MKDSLLITEYWQRYLQTLPAETRIYESYVVDQFGDIPELADELGQLVLNGTKTGTCSVLWEWEAEQSPPPTVGLKTIVLNWEGIPLCIIETTEVTIRAFNALDAQFAYNEGEGDRTLESWRCEHWKYFSRVLPKIGKAPTPDMPLVCERFRVIYPFLVKPPLLGGPR